VLRATTQRSAARLTRICFMWGTRIRSAASIVVLLQFSTFYFSLSTFFSRFLLLFAACMTSECVRPAAAPEESSSSRRTASDVAECSSVSGNPASMLSHRVCARETRSRRGRAIASAVSCSADIAQGNNRAEIVNARPKETSLRFLLSNFYFLLFAAASSSAAATPKRLNCSIGRV
jgi:hypothetical protein